MAELLKYIYTSLPMISSLTCGMLFVIAYQQELTKVEHQAKKLLCVYFILMDISWFHALLYPGYEPFLKYLIPLTCMVIQITQVIFYHYIYLLTPLKKKNPLHIKLHYIPPFVLCVVIGIFMITYLYTDQFSNDDIPTFFRPYVIVSSLFYMVFYIILGSMRIIKYRRRLMENNGTKKWKAMFWIVYLMFLKAIFIVLLTFNRLEPGFITAMMMIVLSAQHLIIVYNMLMKNYTILSSNENHVIMITGGEVISLLKEDGVQKTQLEMDMVPLLTKEELESYYEKNKPYLNAGFKMNDLAAYFEINRTYLSGFINKTFGVNFSQYNNLWRLKEMEYLQKNGDYQDKTQEELSLMAGFGNVRSYWRVKKSFDQKDLSKENSKL